MAVITDRVTVEDIAKEVAAYLPNPGQFEQAIVGASVESDGTVSVVTASEQVFRLTIEAVTETVAA